MSVATLTKPAPVTTEAPKPTPLTPDAIATEALKLRDRYTAADKGETEARTRFEAADIDWQNARVIKVRVAYAASMLTPNAGKANLLAATRFLLTDPADTAGKRTAQAKSRKNTLRNYVAAGEELQAKGLATRISEPDAEERKIVANVFREMNKRDKAEANGTADTDTPPAGDDAPPATNDSDALTVADLVGHVARMQATFNLIKGSGVVISEQEAGKLSEMLAEFSAQLAEYSADK